MAEGVISDEVMNWIMWIGVIIVVGAGFVFAFLKIVKMG
jgi:LPXTG-motif cell wall-anchored protein